MGQISEENEENKNPENDNILYHEYNEQPNGGIDKSENNSNTNYINIYINKNDTLTKEFIDIFDKLLSED